MTDVPDYSELMKPFADAMRAEMEANFYKGAPEPWGDMGAPAAVWQVFYHAFKLAWVAKTRPEDADALLEMAADVANCAFIAADATGCLGGEAGGEPTLIRGEEGFTRAARAMMAWLHVTFGWSAEEMYVSEGELVDALKEAGIKTEEEEKK